MEVWELQEAVGQAAERRKRATGGDAFAVAFAEETRLRTALAEADYGDYDPRYLQERNFTQARRDKLASKGLARRDGGYPIENQSDLDNAWAAIGRAKDRAGVIAHIKKVAKRLGLKLPDALKPAAAAA